MTVNSQLPHPNWSWGGHRMHTRFVPRYYWTVAESGRAAASGRGNSTDSRGG